ncbi:alkaline phosphatase D family protein [Corynebacterium sp. S7]
MNNSTSHGVPRRRFLQSTAIATAAVAAAGAVPAQAQSSSSSSVLPGARALPGFVTPPTTVFMHGVASGDPIPDSVVLWTRVTSSEEAVPGSGLGDDVVVRWEVSSTEDFASIVTSGDVVATAAADHTVHVDPHGLEPNCIYYYRFHALGQTSAVGRTKTAPDYTEENTEVNFGVASCANWESGYFSAYRGLANKALAGDIDAVVFLGDYIYEYENGGYAGKSGVSRPHWPAHEILTLRDYRTRHGRYKQDSYLQEAHHAAPWIVIWDDHETADNSWRDGAENHTEGAEGAWIDRKNAAMQAYFEWLPVRASNPSEGGHLYRSLRFGSLVELTMMDLRTYRDAETSSAYFNAPDRTMLGSEQFEWLRSQIRTSQTSWNVLGNSVMMAPLKLGTIPETSSQASSANEAIGWISERSTGIALNSDQWDGYANDRRILLQELKDKGSNILFLTGDIHSEWANEIYLGDERIGAELVGTSISAPNVDEIITTNTGQYVPENNQVSLMVEDIVRGQNPWVKHLDFDAHGFAVVSIHPADVTMEYYRVSDVEVDNAPVHLAVTKQWSPEAGFIQ